MEHRPEAVDERVPPLMVDHHIAVALQYDHARKATQERELRALINGPEQRQHGEGGGKGYQRKAQDEGGSESRTRQSTPTCQWLMRMIGELPQQARSQE